MRVSVSQIAAAAAACSFLHFVRSVKEGFRGLLIIPARVCALKPLPSIAYEICIRGLSVIRTALRCGRPLRAAAAVVAEGAHAKGPGRCGGTEQVDTSGAAGAGCGGGLRRAELAEAGHQADVIQVKATHIILR